MKSNEKKTSVTGALEERCDTKIWSGACERDDYTNNSDKYLCSACGVISNLTHEMHHEGFPHVSGDDDNLS